MLGQAIYKVLMKFDNYNLFGVSRQPNYKLDGVKMFYGDLSNEDFLFSINEVLIDSIIHCSAEVDVNYCENNKDWAYKSNVECTKNVFNILRAKKYFYISTDSIFDGEHGDYSENEEANPLNYYSETKFLGENEVKKATKNHYIIRTNIYGYNAPMKKSLFEWAYKELIEGKVINGYSNMYFNPIYVGQLAALIDEILNSKIEFGTYNISSSKISKYQFLINIAKSFNLSTSNIVSIEFEQNNLVAPRALNTTLNNSKIKEILIEFDFTLEKGFSMLKKDLLELKN